jgi:hypothetical protein
LVIKSAVYSRAKTASKPQNNIEKIRVMSDVEVSKDPQVSALNKLAASSK